MTSTKRLLLLPGDGVGPEVVDAARSVIGWLTRRRGLDLAVEERLYGGACYDRHGVFITDDTMQLAHGVDAILAGAEGGPKWDSLDIPGGPTDRSALSRLRKELDLFANIRPIRPSPALLDASPLKREVIDGVDFIILRELTGGIYFGEPRGIETLPDGTQRGVDTQSYTTAEIERIARVGFDLARRRRRRLASVEKSNVMESGVLWRRTVERLGRSDAPGVALEHLYADNCMMQIVRAPRRFDVLVTDNLFGDLLSDGAAPITGSLGMLPSASLGPERSDGRRPGLYEPVHGSAPDIAGTGTANPCGTILSVAMMCELTFGRADDARLIERAVDRALGDGAVPRDLGGTATTSEVTAAILRGMDRLAP